MSAQVESSSSLSLDDPSLSNVDPALRPAFVSGYAQVHDATRIPASLRALPNGHEGSHHYLFYDFARAVEQHIAPPIDAWMAARFTLPGIVAHESARRGGERLAIPDFGTRA